MTERRLQIGLAVTVVAAAIVALRYRRRRPKKRIKLTYFDGPGFGDKIRLTLAVGGLAFDDERLAWSDEGYAEARLSCGSATQ